ncbi:FapA family protein [Calidifontibacillus oryziterrae]|uniref:FapA family protein n=1 Tax=Calidifontibacillus oryziterrae TaxID=1191699 RepID=UPI00030BFC8F|nr:FapA family protein [Calidifontibacillus oryziterrae]
MDANIFTGKTVEEAIEIGLQKLGLTKDDASIEVLEEGRKGLLKIGSKPAEVRITKKVESQTQLTDVDHTFTNIETKETENTIETTDNVKGKVWVKGGMIHCVDPDEGELIIHIPRTVLLYKNSELVKEEKISILQKDEISIEFKTEETPTKWVIEQSKDKLEAKIKVEPGFRLTYSLKDKRPAKELFLDTVESREINLTLTREEVHAKLKDLSIVFGILEEQIEAACKSREKAEFVIAIGEKPIEGKNGWLEYKVEINEGKRFKEREDGTIDYREGRDIPSVDEGIVIAIIHEPEEGTPGKAITGEEIPPKPVHPIQVNLGPGASFKENDEKTLVSTSIGRPSIEKRGTSVIVDVVPKFDHKGDVNLASGNLKFHGDITVSGNVDENMSITASGNIEIRGTTSKAKINAGQSVLLYSNVISSEIIAGNSNKIIIEKINELTNIHEQLVAMNNDLHQISKNPSFANVDLQTGIMRLVKVLIQTKYSALVKEIRQFIIAVKDDIEMLNGAWQSIIKDLHDCFIMMDPSALLSIDDYGKLVHKVEQLIEASNIPAEHGASIVLPSAMNSEIYSSGDVIVNKQGCYNSNIYAQGTLEVHGFIRGGQVFAGQGAEIDEVGSKGGTPTLISVPHDQSIKIKNALADTTVQIGKKKYTFTKDMTHVVARLDEAGIVVVH